MKIKQQILAVYIAIFFVVSAFVLIIATPQNAITRVYATTGSTRYFANRYVMDDLRESVM